MRWSGPDIKKSGKVREEYRSDQGHTIRRRGNKYDLSHPDSLLTVRHEKLQTLMDKAEAFPGPDETYAYR